jgi:hypothetical protein
MAMIHFDSIPQARVVRQAGHEFAPPPQPRSQLEPGPFARQLRDVAAIAIGLWPLTGVLLLAIGLLWMAGMNGAP